MIFQYLNKAAENHKKIEKSVLKLNETDFS